MRLRWTPRAAEDLQAISDYLAVHHPSYRQETLRQLYKTIRSLKANPRRGRPGSQSDTRELFILPLPYVAIYRLSEQTIEVLNVFHTSQERPSLQ